MEAHNPYINHLFQRYLEGRYSEEDLDTLLEYFKLDEDSDQLRELIEQQFEKPISETIDQEEVSRIVTRIGKELSQKINPPIETRKFKWWYAAASILLISTIATISYLYIMDTKSDTVLSSQYGDDVAPGSNRATITLADGTIVELDEKQNGVIASGNQLSYTNGEEITHANVDVQDVTMTTPRAGQYQLTLPDGTKVWLNAESTIIYPTRFGQNERRVEIKGEAYLEVYKDGQKPFIVKSNQQEIQVLGTSFNIESYADQGDNVTTLVEGSLRITDSHSKSSSLLRAGQQAITSSKAGITIKDVDTKAFSSWKDGIYFIKNQPLAKFAKQLERWYDVNMDMGTHDNILLSAIVHRDAKLSEVLEAIEMKTGLKFKIEGRRITTIE